jgi:putative inorganic carbon (HCO3(-)) transporter
VNSLPSADWWRPVGLAETTPEAAPDCVAAPVGGGVAFRALLAFTFILVLAPQAWIPALRPFRIALVAAVVGIGAQLMERAAQGRSLTVMGREIALTAALVAWAVVTLPLSYWPGGSASFLLEAYFKTVAIFWLLANAVDTVDRLCTLAWTLTGAAAFVALTAVKNYLSGAFLAANDPVRRIVGYDSGLTTNPNDLALLLNILLPLGVGLLLTTRGGLARLVLLGIVALEAVGVIVTFSRAGFLSLATTVVLLLWRLARRGRVAWALGGLAACVAGVALLPGGYGARLATIADIDADPTGSAQARWGDTVAAVQFVLENPLVGAGVGMNTLALNEMRGPAWKEIHNVYLQYAVDLGLPGCLLFSTLLVCCLRRARAVRRHASEGEAGRRLSSLAEGIEMALVTFAVGAFFHPVGYHFYFYYLAGLAVAAAGIHARMGAASGQGAAAWAS